MNLENLLVEARAYLRGAHGEDWWDDLALEWRGKGWRLNLKDKDGESLAHMRVEDAGSMRGLDAGTLSSIPMVRVEYKWYGSGKLVTAVVQAEGDLLGRLLLSLSQES